MQFKETNRLLLALSNEQRSFLHGRDVVLSPAACLHEPGRAVEYVHFPRSCVISRAVVMQDGKSAGTVVIGREGVVGLSAALGQEIAATRAHVLIGGAVLRVPVARMRALLQQDSGLFPGLMSYQQRLIRETNRLAACNVLHTLEQRLCRWLLTVDRRGDGQPIPVTQEALAKTLGVHRASLHREVRKLHACGAIAENRRGLIRIANRSALSACSCECFAASA